jgi:hypothetical protein
MTNKQTQDTITAIGNDTVMGANAPFPIPVEEPVPVPQPIPEPAPAARDAMSELDAVEVPPNEALSASINLDIRPERKQLAQDLIAFSFESKHEFNAFDTLLVQQIGSIVDNISMLSAINYKAMKESADNDIIFSSSTTGSKYSLEYQQDAVAHDHNPNILDEIKQQLVADTSLSIDRELLGVLNASSAKMQLSHNVISDISVASTYIKNKTGHTANIIYAYKGHAKLFKGYASDENRVSPKYDEYNIIINGSQYTLVLHNDFNHPNIGITVKTPDVSCLTWHPWLINVTSAALEGNVEPLAPSVNIQTQSAIVVNESINEICVELVR